MAGPAASHQGRIAALLKTLPPTTAYRLAEASGLFAPLAPLIDDDTPAGPDEKGEEVGRIAASSLPKIWAWLFGSAAPAASAVFLEAFARAALGSGLAPSSLAATLPRLRGNVGREALDAVRGLGRDDLALELGSNRLAGEALLVGRLLAVAEQLDVLRVADPAGPLPEAFIAAAKGIADRTPEARPAIVSYVLAQLRRTADGVPLMAAFARRKGDSKLDKTDLAPALAGAIEIACTRGADRLQADAADGGAALEAAMERARDVVDLATALRGRVTDDWVRALNARLGRSDRSFQQLCATMGRRVSAAISAGGETVPSDEDGELAAAAARFLIASEPVSGTLRFDEARRRAAGQALRELAQTADAAEEQVRRLSAHSPALAERAIRLRARLIATLQDDRAARAWSRLGRSIVGRPTFEELVLAPLDAVLVDEGVTPVRGGLAARSIVDAFWTWAAAGPLCAVHDLASASHARERDRDPAAAQRLVVDYRAALAAAAQAAFDGALDGLDLLARPELKSQLASVAALLSSDAAIRARLDAWPARLKHVGEAQVAEIRDLHDALTALRPEIEPGLLIVVMGRLERPWQILRILERIARTDSDILVEATEFVAIGEVLIDRAELDAARFRRSPSEPFVAPRALAALERFAGVVSGMTEEFQIRRNGAWGSRLYGLKARASRDLEELCKAAAELVDMATPRTILPNGAWAAAVHEPPDATLVAEAAELARFLKGSKILDHRAAFAGARTAAMQRIEGRLSAHIESLLDIAHGSEGEEREQALGWLRAAARIVGEFEGDGARDVLLRRVAAA